MLDIITRGGKTREGRQIYTDAQLKNEPGTAIKNMTEHLAKAMLPFSYPQITRLYQSAMDKPSERGEFFELPDELWGFAGYRVVPIDPVKSMGFKISGYQRGNREARALFTGGSESVLKGGPKTAREVIERFIVANKAKFNNDKEMLRNITAADTLGTDMDEIRNEFRERQLINTFNKLNNDIFTPYFPSENIQREFRQIEERIGVENPFEEARDVLLEIQDDLRELSFDDEFILNVNDYLTPESDLLGQMLPPTPDVNPALMSQVMPSSNVMETGLTPTEQALLSDEEKGIRLRSRGMTA